MSDITHLLNAVVQGDLNAADQVLPLVYDDLRKLARRRLARERPGQTLDATALVHEAYTVPYAFGNERYYPSAKRRPGHIPITSPAAVRSYPSAQ
jgi:hypothetical protein